MNIVNDVNKPKTTTIRIFDELDDAIKSKPKRVIYIVGTNDLTNVINLLNNSKKNVKRIIVELSTLNFVCSGIINRKGRKNMDKSFTETNQRLYLLQLK